MNVQTVYLVAILIVLLAIIIFSWRNYPVARFVVLSRADGDTSKYIAINSLEVIDCNGSRREIIGVESRNGLPKGFVSANAATTAAANAVGDVVFDGKAQGFYKDNGNVFGPIIAVLPSSDAATGYLLFSLGCPAKIARINIKPPEDDRSRNNIQRVKVILLDKDRKVINGAEQIIPVSNSIPQAIHHISFG